MTKENGWHGKWKWKLAQKFGLNASLGWILWGWRGGGWLRDQVSPSVTQDSFCHKSYCTLLHCSTVLPPPASTIGNYRMGPPVWWKGRALPLLPISPLRRQSVSALISQFQDYHSRPSDKSESSRDFSKVQKAEVLSRTWNVNIKMAKFRRGPTN